MRDNRGKMNLLWRYLLEYTAPSLGRLRERIYICALVRSGVNSLYNKEGVRSSVRKRKVDKSSTPTIRLLQIDACQEISRKNSLL